MQDGAERRQRRIAEAVIDEQLAVLCQEPPEPLGNVGVACLGAAVEQVERRVVDARPGPLEAARIEVRVALDDVLDDVVHELPRDRRRAEALIAPWLVGREARRRYEPGAP